jgi:hypothetical protein
MAALPAPIDGDLDARNCERKVPYSSELNARINAQAVINDTRRSRETPRRMWVYTCPHCRAWHMTTSPQRDSAAVTATEFFAGGGR